MVTQSAAMGRPTAGRVLVGVVTVATALMVQTQAGAAVTRRVVALPQAAPGHIAVAIVRFAPSRRAKPLRLRRLRPRPQAGSSAFVLGSVRLRGGGRIAVAATVNFGGPASVMAFRRKIGANRPFAVDFVGDAASYRGKLRKTLSTIGRHRWTIHASELPPPSVEPRYRSPAVLLDEVRQLVIDKPDPDFLAALAGPPAASAPPPPATAPPPPAAPQPPARTLTRLSSDVFTNTSSWHRTQVEPDSFAFGSTVVTAFQSGRFYDGGASDLGFATSKDAGRTWANGFLPGLTTYLGSGSYDRASDPTVAYDAKNGVWLIAAIGIDQTALPDGAAILVSRSTDGGTSWTAPVTVATGANVDKEWVVCDNHAASPFYGHCYIEWDAFSSGDTIFMSTSTDGGASWSVPKTPSGTPKGYAGQPLVQPDGRVVVAYDNPDSTALLAFDSTDGGQTWSAATEITPVYDHEVAGGLRTEPIPSAEIDAGGRIYVVWQDCRFRSGCSSNDLVMTSTSGAGWSSVTRIPIDPPTSGVDHFIPGLGVDAATAGSGAHLTLAYYDYPVASCSASTCELDVGLVSSTDGGSTWSAPTTLAGPMKLNWLPSTTGGVMVGDYISTSYVGGTALPFFAAANAPSADGTFDEAIYTW
jgi:BNR repeat-like domain